jgi:hypothetical protein
MPRVGFEPTTPVFEGAKTIHDLDRAATVIGSVDTLPMENIGDTIGSVSQRHVSNERCIPLR